MSLFSPQLCWLQLAITIGIIILDDFVDRNVLLILLTEPYSPGDMLMSASSGDSGNSSSSDSDMDLDDNSGRNIWQR